MSEEWKIIEEYPDYSICKDGRVRNNKGKILKQNISRGGYYRVSLCNCSKYVHRLLAEAFIPNPENKSCIDHINRNRLDNRLENLRWATRSENGENRSLLERNQLGEKNIMCLYKVSMKRNGIQYQKVFSTLEEAKAYRDSIETYS